MTKQEVNHIYEESVYQIRLRVAISLLPVSGITIEEALQQADKFVHRLQDEDADWLQNRYK